MTGNYLEWSYIPWRQLSFDMETLHSFERGYSEINKISGLENGVAALGVNVALLTGLGSFEMLTDKLDLLFGFPKNIGSKQFAFSGLGPVQRGTTLSSIKSFKGGHLQAGLVAIVIGEFSKWKAVLSRGSIG